MRFLTPSECAAIFPRAHYLSDHGSKACRVEGGPPDASRLGHFAESLIRWLPEKSRRLLILTNWTSSVGSPFSALRAMRVGLGEDREVLEVPGHCFGPHSWTWDRLEMSRDQEVDGEILVGMLTLTMSASWDGWLVGDQEDAVQFWEGNVVFHSADGERVKAANELLSSMECRTEMV